MTAAPTPDPDGLAQLEAQLEAMSSLLNLPIAAEHRTGVLRFLEVARGMARTLETVALDDAEMALAPVFRLPEPEPEPEPQDFARGGAST